MYLTSEQWKAILPALNEVDKALTSAASRDLVMQAQTNALFQLGMQNPDLMKAGYKMWDRVNIGFRGDMDDIFANFKGGNYSMAKATKMFKSSYGKWGTQAFQAGAMGVGNEFYDKLGLTKKDISFFNKGRRFETMKFRKFLSDYRNPLHKPMHPYDRRLGYYGDSLKGQFFNGKVAGAGTECAFKWVLGVPMLEHCPVCPIYARTIWTWATLPTVPRGGDTPCLFKCYCKLEPFHKTTGRVFDLFGRGTAEALLSPGRYGKIRMVTGEFVAPGSLLAEVESYASYMYKCRQMIRITSGAERMKWIRLRGQYFDQIMRTLPEGYKFFPTQSVASLTTTVDAAHRRGGWLSGLADLKVGDEIVFVRGNYSGVGEFSIQNGRFVYRGADGIRLTIDSEIDVLFSLKDIEFGRTEWRNLAEMRFQGNQLTPHDISRYVEVLSMRSPAAEAILKKLGITRTEAFEKIALARERLLTSKTTEVRFFNESTQAYVRDRKLLHEKIINDYLAKIKATKGQAKFMMTGGRSGAGKSSCLKSWNKNFAKEYIRVDSDAIKELLAKYDHSKSRYGYKASKGFDGIGWRSELYHAESNKIAYQIMERAAEQNKNVIFDSTMRSYDKALRWVKLFREKGYRLQGLFAELPEAKAIERAIARFLNPAENRFVDPIYIMTHGTKNWDTFDKLKEYFKEWFRYNTDVPFGHDPIKLDSFVDELMYQITHDKDLTSMFKDVMIESNPTILRL